tara:strand:- start:143 stop:607 length:465 start_codon:yes stop_codon:yes gene_type:complete
MICRCQCKINIIEGKRGGYFRMSSDGQKKYYCGKKYGVETKRCPCLQNKKQTKNIRIGPPPLKKVNLPKSKDTKYKLNMSTNNRKSIINKKIVLLADTKNIDINKAAIFIKKRMNVLRIFHKNKNPLFCQMITNDMKYIDKKYLDSKAKTKDIC